MIEALIAYIEDQGFKVHVGHFMGCGVLYIRTVVNGLQWGIDWAESLDVLAQMKFPKDYVFREADDRIAQLRKAIEEHNEQHRIS